MNPSYKIIIKNKIFSILILNDNMYEFMYKKDMKICSIFNTQKKKRLQQQHQYGCGMR